MALAITVLVIRMGHTGKACSGDLLTDDQYKIATKDKAASIPYETGTFLFVLSIIYIIGFSCCGLCCCCAVCAMMMGGAAMGGAAMANQNEGGVQMEGGVMPVG